MQGLRIARIVWFMVLSFRFISPVNADDLPVNAQADVLRHQIAEAIKSNRDQDALTALDQYHQLEKKGAKIPPLVLFIEAQIAKRTGDSLRAYNAITAFLKVAQSTEPHYQDAIAMYSTLSADPTVKSRLAARDEAERREREEKARAQARAAAKADAEAGAQAAADAERQREAVIAAARAQEATKQAQERAQAERAYAEAERQLADLTRQISSRLEQCDNEIQADDYAHACSFVLGIGDGICRDAKEKREKAMRRNCEAPVCDLIKSRWKPLFDRVYATGRASFVLPDRTPQTCDISY